MDIINLLQKIFDERVSDDKDLLRLYSRDYWALSLIRDLEGKLNPPLAVVWPESPEEIAELVKLANKYKLKLTPYGGGSGVAGAIVSKGNIIVDMRRMNKVIKIDEDNLFIIVEAGAYLKKIEENLNKIGFSLKHIPQSFPEAVIGGLISTFSIGQFSTKYGGIEDLLINLEIVTPQGEISWVRKNIVPRSAAGPDLKLLYVGGEGNFGIITKAVLKIRPKPPFLWKRSYSTEDFVKANYIIKKLLRKDIIPVVIRIYDEAESLIRFNLDGNLVLIIVEGYIESIVKILKENIDKLFKVNKSTDLGEKYVDYWLKNRFDTITEVSKILVPLNLWFDTIETATTWSNLPNLYTSLKGNLINIEGVKGVLTHSSHFYLNGLCLYSTIIFEKNEEVYWSFWRKAMEIILKKGGTITHHHGIGQLKRKWLKDELGKSYEILKRIKSSIDPNNVLFGGRWV